MRVFAAGLMAVMAAAAVQSTPVVGPAFQATPELFQSWMAEGGQGVSGVESIPEFRLKVAKRVAQWAADQLKDVESVYSIYSWVARASGLDVGSLRSDLENLGKQETVGSFVEAAHAASKKTREAMGMKALGSDEYKYFGFLPETKANVLPGASQVQWSNRFCKKNTAIATWNADKTEITVEIEASECELLHVGDFYLLTTTEGAHPVTINDLSKKSKTTWKVHAPSDPAVMYDLAKKGIRVFAFEHDEAATMVNILDTVEMFLQPNVEKYPTEKAMERNAKFLADYAKLTPTMTKRASSAPIDLNSSLIQTGDFFGIVRLDGIDPMLGWAMGSTTGHTTIAMRDEKNELHVCESTSVTSYWPVNGVQCTPYAQWLKMAQAAGFNLVWAPLAPENRARLDQAKMWEFFNENAGLDYGFHTLLWGWVDTVDRNYPCLPPDYKACLTWDTVEVLFAIGHRIAPEVTDMLAVQAWNLRVGTSGLTPDEIFMHAETVLNISSNVIPTIVEQDSWVYNTTRYGKPAVGRSMVCCAFVCSMWKAGGLFGDAQVNCGELTNLDDYSLGIFDKAQTGANRPEVCKKADPENELCQLVGPYTLNLNHFNEGKIYSGMDSNCSSWAPGVGQDYWGIGKQTQTC